MSENRRILIVSRSLPFHTAGGMEYVAWDLSRALVRAGQIVTVLTTSIPGRPGTFSEDGVVVETAPGTAPGRYSRTFFDFTRDWFHRHGSDVGAVLSVSAGAYGILGEREKHPDVRFVMQAHGTSVGDIRARWSGPGIRKRIISARNMAWLPRDLRAYRHFDGIVAVGPRVEAELSAWPLRAVTRGERVTRIDNGIETDLFRPDGSWRSQTREDLGWKAGDVGIITVSRLHELKGVHEAMRGFARFANSRGGGARLLVVGDGPERSTLETEARRALPGGSVSIFGEARRSDVARLLNASDVFLFTGLRAEVGLPLNVLEGAATGLPLVLSDSLCRDLEPPVEAECVNPHDASDIAAALARAADRSGERSPGARVSRLPSGRTLSEVAARYAELLLPGKDS